MIGIGRQVISPQQNSGPLFINTLRQSRSLTSGLISLFLVQDIYPYPLPSTSTKNSVIQKGEKNVVGKNEAKKGGTAAVVVSSFIEYGNSSMLVQQSSGIKWFSKLQYAQEWIVGINAFKINETGYLNNGSAAIQNLTAGTNAIFSSTIKYILLPGNLQQTVVNYLIQSQYSQNTTKFDKDPNDGLYYYFASCNVSEYQSLWLRMDDYWFEVQPNTFVMDPYPLDHTLCRIGIQPSSSNDVVLGLAFLYNFYMLFDTDQDRVGISFHNVTKSKFYPGPNYVNPRVPAPSPSPTPSPQWTNLQVTMILTIAILISFIVFLLGKHTFVFHACNSYRIEYLDYLCKESLRCLRYKEAIDHE